VRIAECGMKKVKGQSKKAKVKNHVLLSFTFYFCLFTFAFSLASEDDPR